MCARSIVNRVAREFGQKLRSLVAEADRDLVGAVGFQTFLTDLRSTLDEVGREVTKEVLTRKDESGDGVTREGAFYRFKELVEKEWLTPFGRVSVARRYFQRDAGGDGVFPLDERVGMDGKFLTPDLEEMSAFATGLLAPSEVEQLLSKILIQPPSRKAIQRTASDMGEFVELQERAVCEAIGDERPMSTEGDVLVVSWDATSVAVLRSDESSAMTASDAKASSAAKSPDTLNTLNWRMAGVASISTYVRGDGDEIDPERIDARFLARMPQPSMHGLIEQVESLPSWLLDPTDYRDILVICDGNRTIWEDAHRIPWLKAVRHVLDFYHAAQHVGVVGDALFGEETAARDCWTEAYCHRLKHDPEAVDALIRSIRYYCRKQRLSSAAKKIAQREIKYFARYRHQMNYAELRSLGLPIGSGPVEAACKNIVGARLKRSGMRWSIDGGQQILNLRTHIKSNTWDVAWAAYLSRNAA